jgi:hypothetical protein
MKIGFDFDGVIMNIAPIFRAMIYNTFKTHDYLVYDGKGNELFKYGIEGVSNTKIWNVIHKVMREYQPCASPVAGAVELLHKVYGHSMEPIEIVTARPDDVEEQTRAWIENHFKVPYNLTMVPPPKNGHEKNAKVGVINELELDAFVEDRFKYASEIAQQCDNIRMMFLLNKSYNTGRRVAGKVIRIDSLYEIMPYFIRAYGHGCSGCPMS